MACHPLGSASIWAADAPGDSAIILGTRELQPASFGRQHAHRPRFSAHAKPSEKPRCALLDPQLSPTVADQVSHISSDGSENKSGA